MTEGGEGEEYRGGRYWRQSQEGERRAGQLRRNDTLSLDSESTRTIRVVLGARLAFAFAS